MNIGRRPQEGKAPVSGFRFHASIPNDFADGPPGMAPTVKGAKKFVRTWIRFHDNCETQRLANEARSFPAAKPEDE